MTQIYDAVGGVPEPRHRAKRVPLEPAEAGEVQHAGDKAVTGFSHTILIIWSILVILPMIWVFMSSFKTSSEIFASPLRPPAAVELRQLRQCLDRRRGSGVSSSTRSSSSSAR